MNNSIDTMSEEDRKIIDAYIEESWIFGWKLTLIDADTLKSEVICNVCGKRFEETIPFAIVGSGDKRVVQTKLPMYCKGCLIDTKYKTANGKDFKKNTI